MTILPQQVTEVAWEAGVPEWVARISMVKTLDEMGYDFDFAEASDPTRPLYFMGEAEPVRPDAQSGPCVRCGSVVYHLDPVPIGGKLVCTNCAPHLGREVG